VDLKSNSKRPLHRSSLCTKYGHDRLKRTVAIAPKLMLTDDWRIDEKHKNIIMQLQCNTQFNGHNSYVSNLPTHCPMDGKSESFELVISVDMYKKIWTFTSIYSPCQILSPPPFNSFRIKHSKNVTHCRPKNEASTTYPEWLWYKQIVKFMDLNVFKLHKLNFSRKTLKVMIWIDV